MSGHACRSAVPILVTVLTVFLLGSLLRVPMKLIAFLLSVVPIVRREGALELGDIAVTVTSTSACLY